MKIDDLEEWEVTCLEQLESGKFRKSWTSTMSSSSLTNIVDRKPGDAWQTLSIESTDIGIEILFVHQGKNQLKYVLKSEHYRYKDKIPPTEIIMAE